MCECTPSRAELLRLKIQTRIAVLQRIDPALAEVLRDAQEQQRLMRSAAAERQRRPLDPPQPDQYSHLFALDVTETTRGERLPVGTDRMR
ncbi:Uncharacterised protein [Mycobacteroides abscessus subsp. abscessus]|nr:Uncharacterised protein [Mycobacteroides abscessus subsp. abscessus]SKD11169.1 Uncharacterised protein [Mycobacteroides abscessus subsp. abscessus]SKL37724.1 Uncharacterised protein [Mycobacteroides abscessus subsp. abscessus]SKM28186.1 Uncharacterised protein [Mycobacteroides abscessus subsp. abscessus]